MKKNKVSNVSAEKKAKQNTGKRKVKKVKEQESAIKYLIPTPRHIKEAVNLYDLLIYTYLRRKDGVSGGTNDNEHPAVDFNGFSANGESQVFYVVERFDNTVSIDFRERLRLCVPSNVKIHFYDKFLPHIINWGSPEMRARLKALNVNAEQQSQDDVTVYNYSSKVEGINRTSLIEESLAYLVDADKTRQRSLWHYSVLIQVSIPLLEDSEDVLKNLEREAQNCGLHISRVLYDIESVFKQFNPFAAGISYEGVKDAVSSFTVTDEILSRFISFKQGGLLEEGFYFGVDVNSFLPVVYSVKKNPTDAENWVITAETGGGKSYFVKPLLLQFTARGYYLTIMDIEGFEYADFPKYIQDGYTCEILNLGDGNGKYFDPVAIFGGKGEIVDLEAKATSTAFTLTILRTLMGKAYESSDYIPTILETGLSNLYKNRGVTNNPSTWVKSQDLTLKDVYESICNLSGDRETSSNYPYVDALNCVKVILGKYFDEDGVSAHLFSDRLKIEDIRKNDVLICSFGMAGKSYDTLDPVRLNLMQVTAAQVTHQRSLFAKSQGRFNVKVWEEFQRWSEFPNSKAIIGTAITGGRKLGDVNIVVTNVIGKLLDNDTMGVIGNTNTFFCGAIADKRVRQKFAESFLMPELEDDLEMLSNSSNSKGMLGKAFLCCFNRRDFALSKMILPSEVASSSLFQTGVDTGGSIE